MMAGIFLAINRQLLELESCLNTLWNRQVFQIRFKKFSFLGFEFSAAELTNDGAFEFCAKFI